jgi:hypothetical protein
MFYLILKLLGAILFLRDKNVFRIAKKNQTKNDKRTTHIISSCYLHGLIFFSFGAIPGSRLWHSLMRHSPPKLLLKNERKRIKKTLDNTLSDTNSQRALRGGSQYAIKASESDFAKSPLILAQWGSRGRKSPSAPLLDKVHVVGIF